MAELPSSVQLEVATPNGMVLSIQTESVQLPSSVGELGALGGHVPLLAALRPGILTFKKDGQLVRAAVGGGFAEVLADRVRLIAEFYMTREQVDAAAARRDLEAVEIKLKALKATVDDVEYKELEREQQLAQARLQLAGGDSN
jgi:F-type H+-transporting ATPase subunit epsilon